MLPFIYVIELFIQFIFPLTKTYDIAISSNTKKEDQLLWMCFWIINSYLIFFETSLFPSISCFPLYSEIKCLVLMWLYHHNYRGALYLWFEFFEERCNRFQEFIITQGGVLKDSSKQE
eukprot:GDKJ01016980.1.p1 GENE.GDKJ01016980.1~~GDKJ01016980.1.p1  ORF type:complete len:118 (+),score=0.41 GDKJ01016980.1:34-387(+)